MTVLVDWQIAKAIAEGEIIMDPCDERQINSGSVDIRLGEWFFREDQPNSLKNQFVYPWNESSAKQMWGQPIKAPLANSLPEAVVRSIGVDPNDQIIVLHPHETILGHTQEFIGGKNRIITHMQARSSIGRMATEVCKCAGWGDHGYFNRWTMELTNNAQYHNIVLVVGRRVAQIVFVETEQPDHMSYSKNGKYQGSGDLETLKANWSPYQMLPRLDLDWDIVKTIPT